MQFPKQIAIGSDHAGFEYKSFVISFLQSQGIVVKDFGTYSTESVDYPDYVHPLCQSIENGDFAMGVLICGSGNGVAMAANKHAQIRAALCWNKEIASLARKHNDANVICIPARFIAKEYAQELIQTFLSTDFEGGRHQRRVEKIPYCS